MDLAPYLTLIRKDAPQREHRLHGPVYEPGKTHTFSIVLVKK
jgi:hypothetical protein